MKLFPKIQYQSIFSALGFHITSWLYNFCHAFRGNWDTDYSVWDSEILKRRRKKRFSIGGFSLLGLRNFTHTYVHSRNDMHSTLPAPCVETSLRF